MIARVWRVSIDEKRARDYLHFAEKYSRPMFQRQKGFVGAVFGKQGTTRIVITMWEGPDDVERLEESELYQTTVREIESRGLLEGPASLEVYDVELSVLTPALSSGERQAPVPCD